MDVCSLNEYSKLPAEYTGPTREWNRPVREYTPVLKSQRAVDIHQKISEETRKKKASNFKKRLKIYAMSTATAISAVTAISFSSPKWDINRVQKMLSEHPLAYYAESLEKLEYYVENELWYSIFGSSPDGHIADFYGMYGKSDNGPTDKFREALTLSPVLHEDDGSDLGLSSYSYSLNLGNISSNKQNNVYSSEVILLENERQVIASWVENGEEHFQIIEDNENDDPSTKTVICNYDINIDDQGNTNEQVKVYGNGADIVGVWESNPEEEYIIVHATSEHSNDPTGNGPSYLVEFTHNPK